MLLPYTKEFFGCFEFLRENDLELDVQVSSEVHSWVWHPLPCQPPHSVYRQ